VELLVDAEQGVPAEGVDRAEPRVGEPRPDPRRDWRVGRLVRSTHERMDGLGYPDGLSGNDIPLLSRIIAACDAFFAMTEERPYRRALASEDAIAELRRCAGAHFDPDVVEALIGAYVDAELELVA